VEQPHNSGPAGTEPAQSPAPSMRIGAAVTAYHPDQRLAAVVKAALESCRELVVVDNTPPGAAGPAAADLVGGLGATVVRPGANLGLAGALNLAVRELGDGPEAFLFLDQDSELPPETVAALAAHLDDPAVGIAAPTPWDRESGSDYDNLAAIRADVADRTDVITSGMLVRRACLEQAGPFREDFFVDFVDIDFCLRARRAGWRIRQDQRLKLPHSLGDRRPHRLGPLKFQVLHYPAWRHYWIARGAAVLLRENLRRDPRWIIKGVLFLLSWTWRAAAFGPERASHVTAVLRGTRDGFSGRLTAAYLPQGALYVGTADKTKAPKEKDA
jgi:rhamnosyltransferase